MAETAKRKKARDLIRRTGYAAGGHFSPKNDEAEDKKMIERAFTEHDDQLHGGKKTRLKLKRGGHVEGAPSRRRADKKPRGGVKVNIMVGHPQPHPMPVPVPMKAPPQAALGAGLPPPGGVPPIPPDGGAGGPNPIPPGLKRGGKAKGPISMRDPIKGLPESQFKRGGRAVKAALKGYPIDDGAGGGLGRLEKAKRYGD